MNNRQNTFEQYVKDAVQIAKDLLYPEEVIEKIEEAKSEIQVDNILHDARKTIRDGNIYLWED